MARGKLEYQCQLSGREGDDRCGGGGVVCCFLLLLFSVMVEEQYATLLNDGGGRGKERGKMHRRAKLYIKVSGGRVL